MELSGAHLESRGAQASSAANIETRSGSVLVSRIEQASCVPIAMTKLQAMSYETSANNKQHAKKNMRIGRPARPGTRPNHRQEAA